MSLHIYEQLEQGSDEWLQARCGIVTASVIGQLITPKTIKVANNVEVRSLTAQLAAERITGYADDSYTSADMENGHFSEPMARDKYSEHYAPVSEVGFLVRDDWGFRLGYSPDGVVGDEGLIEIKTRKPKKHVATVLADEVPLENIAQCQAALLVSGRKWLDYVSYCGGMKLWVKRVLPDRRWHEAILDAVAVFEDTAAEMIAAYEAATAGMPTTERIDYFAEMSLT